MATLTTAGVTFGDGTVQTTAAVAATAFNLQSQLFTSSGTWTCPAGVTQVKALVVGGGGGGGGSNGNNIGGNGGVGGFAIGYYTTVPGTVYTITVGKTGSAANTGNPGGTSSFGALASATGGSGGGYDNAVNGANGTSTSGTLTNGTMTSGAAGIIGTTLRPRAGGTAAFTYTATSGFIPGASGQGAVFAGGAVGGGGVGGIVLLEYVS